MSSPIIPMEWTSRMWLAEGRVEEAGHAAQIVADASDKAEARLGRGVLLKVYFEVAHLVERAGGKVCALADVVELVSGVVDDVMLVRHVVALAVGNVCRWFGVAIGGFDKEFLLWECLAD
ncbi:MAG: hypothetical protein LBH11_00105 [Propionibacteriaceae bacterium]|nr:hypothetical protein [Propionibacteriaceae bacterium]